jgi:phosphoglycerate dehydrogenase-like enzyme
MKEIKEHKTKAITVCNGPKVNVVFQAEYTMWNVADLAGHAHKYFADPHLVEIMHLLHEEIENFG